MAPNRLLASALRFAGVVVLAAGALISAPSQATACSCIQSIPLQDAARADAIFVGRLVAAEGFEPRLQWSSMDPVVYRFDVERVLKGAVPANAEVHSVISGGSCGLEGMEVGQRYTVFARLDDGDLRSGLCDGTSRGDPDPLVAAFTGTILPPEPERPPPWVFGAVILGAALAVAGWRVSVTSARTTRVS